MAATLVSAEELVHGQLRERLEADKELVWSALTCVAAWTKLPA